MDKKSEAEGLTNFETHDFHLAPEGDRFRCAVCGAPAGSMAAVEKCADRVRRKAEGLAMLDEYIQHNFGGLGLTPAQATKKREEAQ